MHLPVTRSLDLPARYLDQHFAERLIGRVDLLPPPRRRPAWAALLCAAPVSLALLSATATLFGGPAPI